ncbi:MAG: replication restart helicase PriA [Candidatus Spyradocola sp.]
MDINSEQVDRLFTYAVPEGMELAPGERVTVPFGPRRLPGVVVELSAETDVDPEKIRPILDRVDDEPVVLPELMDLARWLKAEYRCTMAAALRCILPAQVRAGLQPLTRLAVRLLVPREEALTRCKRSQRQQELIEALAAHPEGERLAALPQKNAAATARALEKKGLAEVFSQRVRRRPYADLPDADSPVRLSAGQENAARNICAALDGEPKAFLLHGVTGSGKTEVYIRAVREALLRGKGAILLVPEIALTPQMVSWFRARFGDVAAVLHSRLSQGEKYDEWRRIREGEARVVIGARSAVFAPVESLGLLIVDEEHEGTYRSGTHPCYDARDVARVRCRLQGATLVLGSATPSVETYARTLRGHNVLLEMRERVAGRPLPTVEVVDMRKELIAGNRSMFSRALRDAVEETLLAGEQVVLFHNRRGHSSFVKCRACGYTVHCPHCDVTMTYHSSDETLKCHYCGAVLPPPKTCPACGSPFIRKFGVGTQQVEEKFRQEFPAARVLRMDMDTTRGKDDLVKLLTAFRRGEAQVLIGTQMVAKGHDFPNVTLVGVIMADMSLNVPDYRSEERTFQLLTQVEGRAGRGEKPGRVVVQSYEPEHYAIAMAATQDYRAFYEAEITRRRRRLYPPYAVLTRLLVTGREESDVRAEAELLEMEIDAWFRQDSARRRRMIQVRAMEAPLSRIRDEFRYQVFVKLYASGSEEALAHLSELAASRHAPGLRVELEIDPPSFL